MHTSDYELSGQLFALRRKLADNHSGIVLTADEVVGLTGELKTLGIVAQRQEHELRRLRATNTVAVARRDGMDAVLAAAAQPGSNVRLLAPERPFSDGRPA